MTKGLGAINLLLDLKNSLQNIVMTYREARKVTGITNPILEGIENCYVECEGRIMELKASHD
jgi:hypothetical protein